MNSITLKKLYTNFLVNPHQYFKTESELENIYNKLIVYLNNLGQTLTVDQQEYIFGKTILKQIKIKNQYYFDTFLSYPNQMTRVRPYRSSLGSFWIDQIAYTPHLASSYNMKQVLLFFAKYRYHTASC